MTGPDTIRTICIIDCNEQAVIALQQLLADLDARFAIFGDAESFLLHVCSDNPLPSCLIVEMLLPGISGLELFNRLKNRGHRVPTVIVASETSVSTAVRAIRAGVLDYFEKPLVEPRLRNVVASILDGSA